MVKKTNASVYIDIIRSAATKAECKKSCAAIDDNCRQECLDSGGSTNDVNQCYMKCNEQYLSCYKECCLL
ncbi:hypothetical protein [Wolbachia endosymbiont of Folsomia candida]|uniref:hypothetical protein n=1 Tax=Wolbachia endosymbiont of Folsomia candida TaxID=169402 RepID=UPI000B618D52|nr:hypothetical protein [Wolbachia endosymbiont of Folsomia candida]APR98892.1 hypothetical protein ASM33_06770 [Wolbachia endosymbiont of Folsomia candida]